MKKLLLISSNTGHLKSFFELVKDYFDEILVVSNAEFEFCQSKILSFQIKNPILLIKEINELSKIIKEFNPTLIHVHQANSFALIATAANRKRIPLVLTTWGSDVLLLPNQSLLYKLMVKYSLKRADFITADAKFMAEAVEKLSGRTDTLVTNFGIDIQREPSNLYIKEKIIYSNRLHKDLYNIDLVILGLKAFLTTNKDWKLLIAANGENTCKLQKLAAEELPPESYEFVGFVSFDENIQNYQRAKIFVSIPQSDGTAVSLLEAMAYGCIPIVSDLPSNIEWITHQKNGIVTAPQKLDTAILEALKLDQEAVSNTNRQIIHTRASKTANRARFYEIYKQIDGNIS